MSFWVAGAAIGGAVLTSQSQKKAAKTAAGAQQQSTDAAIAESQRQFDEFQRVLKPYVQAGEGGLGGLMDIIGLGGEGAQSAAIENIQQSPQFEAIMRQGEEAILQNASATGGLRGGNTQAALARFRPQVLSDLIQQQYSRLAGVAQLGQASAAGTGSAALQTGQNVGNLLVEQGQAMGSAALARGNANANLWGNIAGAVGYAGANWPRPNAAIAQGSPAF